MSRSVAPPSDGVPSVRKRIVFVPSSSGMLFTTPTPVTPGSARSRSMNARCRRPQLGPPLNGRSGATGKRGVLRRRVGGAQVAQLFEALDQKRGADEQHEREGRLADDEQVAP